MAPEQARGEKVDPRCDLFSLGCVLYRIATGKPPFRGTDTISTLMAVAVNHPRPPHELEPGLPPVLSALIMGLLAKETADRPPSAQAVAESPGDHLAASCRRREPSGALEAPGPAGLAGP